MQPTGCRSSIIADIVAPDLKMQYESIDGEVIPECKSEPREGGVVKKLSNSR